VGFALDAASTGEGLDGGTQGRYVRQRLHADAVPGRHGSDKRDTRLNLHVANPQRRSLPQHVRDFHGRYTDLDAVPLPPQRTQARVCRLAIDGSRLRVC
jgi:hypothetical protein